LILKTSVGALALVAAAGAFAAPITVNLSAWYLEHIGANSIGFSGGVEAVRSIAFADTSPDGSAVGRSTATITQGGATAPIDYDPSPLSRGFIRAQVNPAGAQLDPIEIKVSNGADFVTMNFGGRSLFGLTPMELITGFRAQGSPTSPLISWAPLTNSGDIDALWLAFYNDDTNTEAFPRQFLPANATSYQLPAVLPAGFNLTVAIRAMDYFDDSATRFQLSNIQRQSRTFFNYSVPGGEGTVPVPATALLLTLGMLGLFARSRGVSGS
jgi:hypothetical protein